MSLVCHDADHHQDAIMLTKNQNKDSGYNREKIVGVSTFAANLADGVHMVTPETEQVSVLFCNMPSI